MNNRSLIFFLFVLFFYFSANAQRIRNTDFYRDGNNIIVTYEIKGLDKGKVAKIELFVSTDGGKSFKGPLKHVDGDVGEISNSGDKHITWNIFDEVSLLQGDIVFEVRAKIKRLPLPYENLIFYNASESAFAGLTFGRVSRVGYYLRLKTNISFDIGYDTNDDNWLINYDGDGYYTYTDKYKSTRLGLSCGLISRLHKNVYLYAGGGLGYSSILWHANEFSYNDNEKIGDLWAKHNNRIISGIELEAGIMIRFGMLNFSFGYNSVDFTINEVHGGIGIFF